jgi:hypothetical protein
VPTPTALYGTVSHATLDLLQYYNVAVTSIRNPISYQYKIGNKLAVLAATALVCNLPQRPRSRHASVDTTQLHPPP